MVSNISATNSANSWSPPQAAGATCSRCPGGSGGGNSKLLIRILGITLLVALVGGAIAFAVWLNKRRRSGDDKTA